MEITNFLGDLTHISAKNEALVMSGARTTLEVASEYLFVCRVQFAKDRIKLFHEIKGVASYC